MTTLVIDRQTLPKSLMPFIESPHVTVSAEPDRVVLTPAAEEAEDDEPFLYDIDPADYDDETDYINAIPGLAERLLAYRNLPESEFEDWDWRKELGWDEVKGVFTKVTMKKGPRQNGDLS